MCLLPAYAPAPVQARPVALVAERARLANAMEIELFRSACEDLDRIFEPVWPVDPSQRTNQGGTGLGLSVVRRLVHLLGGRVAVESQVGRGSAFPVRLPPRPDPGVEPGSA